jgi:putative peptidoglycan lipid II flippase
MLKSSGGIGAATLTSRILGLVREQVYAAFMGTTEIYGAFIYAYMVPNLFRRLLGEGALTAAFIPIFKAKEKTEGEASMWRATNAVLSGLIAFSAGLVLLVMVIVTVLLLLGTWRPETRLMLRLMRVMFPYLTLACVGAVMIGILNARGHFFIPALGAALLNVVMIASVLFLAPHMGHRMETQIFALAVGVLVAGVAQALFQVPTLWKEGFRYQWVSPWHDATVREVVKKMVPSVLGVAAFQINVMMTNSLAFGESGRIVGEFAYAVRLMELPQGVFGLSLATFLLPTLAGFAVEKKFDDFRLTLRQAVGHIIFINLLALVLLVTLAAPIIRLLFEHGKFDANSTERVSFALVCLAPGLVFFSLVNIFARAFYALGDILSPMRVSLFCLAINLLFTCIFLYGFRLGPGALGLANTLSSGFNIGLLALALRKKLRRLDMKECARQWPALAAIGLVAGVVAWSCRILWQNHLGHDRLGPRLGEVFLPMILATAVYFGLSSWLKVGSAGEMLRILSARFYRRARPA